MIPFSWNRTPYPSETEHMATHLTASQLNYICVGVCEDVILITPHPACPHRGHYIQSEPLDCLILTSAKVHKWSVQKQQCIFFWNRKCMVVQPSFNTYSKLWRILLLSFIKKILTGTVKCVRIFNASEFRESYIYGYLPSCTYNLGQIIQTSDLL